MWGRRSKEQNRAAGPNKNISLEVVIRRGLKITDYSDFLSLAK
jgi:hypothetical protein